MSSRLSLAFTLFSMAIVAMIVRGMINHFLPNSSLASFASDAILMVIAPGLYIGGIILAFMSKEADSQRIKNDTYLR